MIKQKLIKEKIILAISFGMFLITLVIQVSVTNNLAIKGKEAQDFLAQKDTLEKQISELKLEKSKYASIAYIEDKAKDLGFVDNPNYVVAIRADTHTAALSPF